MRLTASKMCIRQKGAVAAWLHSHCCSLVADAELQPKRRDHLGVRLCRLPLLRIQRSRWTRQASVGAGEITRRARVTSMLADDAEPSTAPSASGVEARAEAVLRQSRQIPFGF